MDGRQVLVLVSCREPVSIAAVVVFGCGRQAADDAAARVVLVRWLGWNFLGQFRNRTCDVAEQF